MHTQETVQVTGRIYWTTQAREELSRYAHCASDLEQIEHDTTRRGQARVSRTDVLRYFGGERKQ